MRKNNILIILLILVFATMNMSCINNDKNEISKISDGLSKYQDTYQIHGIKMEIKNVEMNTKTEIFELVLENNTKASIKTGSDYELCILEAGEWNKVDFKQLDNESSDYGSTDIRYQIEPDKRLSFNIYLEMYEIVIGQYRIIKMVNDEPISIEFQITE